MFTSDNYQVTTRRTHSATDGQVDRWEVFAGIVSIGAVEWHEGDDRDHRWHAYGRNGQGIQRPTGSDGDETRRYGVVSKVAAVRRVLETWERTRTPRTDPANV